MARVPLRIITPDTGCFVAWNKGKAVAQFRQTHAAITKFPDEGQSAKRRITGIIIASIFQILLGRVRQQDIRDTALPSA